ncbi:sensor domain-containing diguanylate cyclase [Deinococcus fonticola]|uniref:GGDEF domain-containing protein n=1 Tax=Deinococcus fonticola TaxID=2528713 RepID=UPI00107518C7|nr:diguanylate cyclase [Deinococcus fonticola]
MALRYVLLVALGLYLTPQSLFVFDGIRFDFRAVVVALVARRHGVFPALLVALPISLYRMTLGGNGMWWGILQMFLIATLGALGTGWARLHPTFQEETLRRRCLTPLVLYAVANLTYFPAYVQAGRPWMDALPVYVATALLGALGLFVAHEVMHGRLQTLSRTSQLHQLASVDSLTGCFNRRQFDADFQPLRPGETAFLLWLDLDHFKRINDTYGHAMGDQVLVALADTLRETTRATDCLYRVGGEEFAVLLNGGSMEDARRVSERVREAVETTLMSRVQLPDEQVTLSGGLVAVQGERHRVLQVADTHLYAAKEAGRNRIHG